MIKHGSVIRLGNSANIEIDLDEKTIAIHGDLTVEGKIISSESRDSPCMVENSDLRIKLVTENPHIDALCATSPEGLSKTHFEVLAEFFHRFEAIIPTLATKADIAKAVGDIRAQLHKELQAMTWKIWVFAAGLVTIVFGLAKLIK